MASINELKKKFDPNHVVIDINRNEGNTSSSSRRISINTLEWLSGKVELLRRKFSAAAHEEADLTSFQKNKTVKEKIQRKMSESDGDLLQICRKYQIASSNKYTWISEPFESIVVEYGEIVRNKKIEIHREVIDPKGNHLEPPRGVLLLPLSNATGEALLDFSEMGGYSLGRGSRVAKKATRALSRTHCMVYLEDNRVYLKDCDSKTGTFINGRLLGSSVPNVLDNFDIIQLGYGDEEEDYIQAMIIFLSDWSKKEFSASIQQLNSPQMTFSRTLSSASLNTFNSDFDYDRSEAASPKKLLPNSPLVSSPKLTEIKSQQIKPTTPEVERIIFERPSFNEPEEDAKSLQAQKIDLPSSQKIEPIREIQSAKISTNTFLEQFDSSPPSRAPESAKSEGYKVYYNRKPASGTSTIHIPSTPIVKPLDTKQLESEQSGMISRPPIPKPRHKKKGLTKSAENLIEVELDELVQDVEKVMTLNSPPSTVKPPMNVALSARRQSVQPQPTVNFEIPEFLKAENLKIPAKSPVNELLMSSSFMTSTNRKVQRNIDLPVNQKRFNRIEGMKRESVHFSSSIQGANTKRFETLIDFGAATSDISDGLAKSQLNKSESVQFIFNNFRITWSLACLNQKTNSKVAIEALSKNMYELSVEAGGGTDHAGVKIGILQMNLTTKLEAKVILKITDSLYKEITGNDHPLPLKALEQLSYFYPHLETVSVLIQGAPDTSKDKVTISLVTSKKTTQVGRILFEFHRATWSRRQMVYALDLDTSEVEVDSLLSDMIQSVSLLYCLRYHID